MPYSTRAYRKVPFERVFHILRVSSKIPDLERIKRVATAIARERIIEIFLVNS